MTTVNGTIKKTAVKDYANIRQSGMIAIKIDDGDELRWVRHANGEQDIVISTSFGQAIRFSEKEARPMGRTARGVRGIKLRAGDKVVGMDTADAGKQFLVISENGYGKKTKVENFEVKHRGGMGIRAAVVDKKTGNLMTVRLIDTDDTDILAISKNGITIRVGLGAVPTLGRTTKGVRIMKLADGDAVASVGIIQESDKDDTEPEKEAK
jgi:DNA gyrase subunit A